MSKACLGIFRMQYAAEMQLLRHKVQLTFDSVQRIKLWKTIAVLSGKTTNFSEQKDLPLANDRRI